MLAHDRQGVSRRPTVAVVGSILAHLLVVAAMFWQVRPDHLVQVKRGEPLFIELPEIHEAAPPGNPAERTPGPPAPPAPRLARPVAPAPPTPAAPAAPPRVAKAAPPAPPRPRQAPSPQPSAPDSPSPSPQHAAPETPTPTDTAKAETAKDETPAPARPASEAPPGDQSSQVARAVPDAPDIRSALKRGGGGGGGRTAGRGGIEGEPISLETKDPRYSDYFEHLRRKIKSNWGYPCVKLASGECEYKSAEVVIEFGIGKQGDLKYVDVVHSSGYRIYDDYAVNAIKLSPLFRRVPDDIGRTGIIVLATFQYTVETSLHTLLR